MKALAASRTAPTRTCPARRESGSHRPPASGPSPPREVPVDGSGLAGARRAGPGLRKGRIPWCDRAVGLVEVAQPHRCNCADRRLRGPTRPGPPPRGAGSSRRPRRGRSRAVRRRARPTPPSPRSARWTPADTAGRPAGAGPQLSAGGVEGGRGASRQAEPQPPSPRSCSDPRDRHRRNDVPSRSRLRAPRGATTGTAVRERGPGTGVGTARC